MKSLGNTLERFKQPSEFTKKVSSIGDIKSFNFERGLKSKNIPTYHFTNFAKDQNDEAYDITLNYYMRFLDNDYSFFDEFYVEEELYYNYREDRLFDIINDIQKVKYTKNDCHKIIKMKNVYNKELHLYLYKNNDNYSILLIDLYHLAIFGRKIENGKEHITPVYRKYRWHSGNNQSLDYIKILGNIEKNEELVTN